MAAGVTVLGNSTTIANDTVTARGGTGLKRLWGEGLVSRHPANSPGLGEHEVEPTSKK